MYVRDSGLLRSFDSELLLNLGLLSRHWPATVRPFEIYAQNVDQFITLAVTLCSNPVELLTCGLQAFSGESNYFPPTDT